jgi:hypothetical protein
MVAEFGLLLACGLAVVAFAMPWKLVAPAFFRTQSILILGLLILASVDLWFGRGAPWLLAACIAASVAAYFAAVAWGLGLATLGRTLFALIASGLAVLVAFRVPVSRHGWREQTLDVASHWASAALLGATLTAMLLGHYYLTAPAMSIAPLRRLVGIQFWTLMVRLVLAGAALASVASRGGVPMDHLLIAMRWGMGALGAGVATYLAWKTVAIRSTQSATGILYIAIVLVLFGELSGLILGRQLGILV